jgi:hypothetical protein
MATPLRTTALAGLASWAIGMLLLGAGLLAKHVVALPAPTLAPALLTALDSVGPDAVGPHSVGPHNVDPHRVGPHGAKRDRAAPAWKSVHVLYSECRCSQRIVSHLLDSPRPPEFREVILWVGQVAPPAKLRTKFHLIELTRARLASFGIEAAPTLLVIDPAGRLRYSGGYTERKQGPKIMDLAILEEARLGAPRLDSLPIFGCAVSERLKEALSILPSP